MEKIELSTELVAKVFKLWYENNGSEKPDEGYDTDAEYFLSLLEELTDD